MSNSTPFDLSTVRLLDLGQPIAAGEDAIGLAAIHLRNGDVVAIPTDTVYGLAAALSIPGGIATIFRIKDRESARSLPVLVADVGDVHGLLDPAARYTTTTERLLRLAAAFWPGGLTVALPARAGLDPAVVAADGTVGVRVPDDPITRELLQRAGGALAVTSANRSGQPTPPTAAEIATDLGSGAAPLRWVLDGGTRVGGVASTVIGVAESEAGDGDRLTIHRVGVVGIDALLAAWQAPGSAAR